MYRHGRAYSQADRFALDSYRPIPSFSSTLLDKIYRSIDEPETQLDEPMSGKLSKCSARSSRITQDPEIDGVIGACLAGDATEKKVMAQSRHASSDMDRKMKVDNDFFSSNSSSSDTSSGGFSSSDTESMFGVRPRHSSFVPPPIPRPKPVRTSASSARLEKSSKTEKMTGERQRTLSQDQWRAAPPPFDVCHRYPSTEEAQFHHDDSIIKSKSRALKIYANLKKVKQPISPGARLSNFINSLFASGNAKKPKSFDDADMERKSKSVQASACSSAASFSRSCLSKNLPGAREKSRDGAKRSVRFYPVSVIVDEDLKPCGHKCLYGPGEAAPTWLPFPSHRRAGRSLGRKAEKPGEDARHNVVVERSRNVEAAAREFLRDYHGNQKRNRSSPRESYRAYEDDDDDVSSCSSSDLFELDHLAVTGSNSWYREELPVYEETTHVGRTLAVAPSGLTV